MLAPNRVSLAALPILAEPKRACSASGSASTKGAQQCSRFIAGQALQQGCHGALARRAVERIPHRDGKMAARTQHPHNLAEGLQAVRG